MNETNPIKQLGLRPEHFLGHGYWSGANPEIQSTDRVTRFIVDKLELSAQQAIRLQEAMLTTFDSWERELKINHAPEAAGLLSQAFMETYGFKPEDLDEAVKQAMIDTEIGNFQLIYP